MTKEKFLLAIDKAVTNDFILEFIDAIIRDVSLTIHDGSITYAVEYNRGVKKTIAEYFDFFIEEKEEDND